ncbi:unnamed protein product [Agarophyton chilense]|eukprot:gb/GEZJ01002287.1/.p2 GENE.gb/GEZJ01002287.1/~~gb/GEZJ01002287.1/.p2  ORF type:complete len:498 (+),score=58.65 gb/GEZJ01002287.1/:647-2140(+)
MTHLQRHPEYGLRAVHDTEIEHYLETLDTKYGCEPTFVQTVLEISSIYEENLSPNTLTGLNLDYDVIPDDPTVFFHEICNLARTAPFTAAACLDTSSITSAYYNAATGGVKELERPFRAAFFIDRFVTRVRDMKDRRETPFAVLQAVAAEPKLVDFSEYVCRYEIFIGPQESDGRIQSASFPDQTVMRAALLCIHLASGPNVTYEQMMHAKRIRGSLQDQLKPNFTQLQDEYDRFVQTMNEEEKVNALMCTLAGRNFLVERSDVALACYYWDPTTLREVRVALQKYAEDANGPKLYGYYRRIAVAWTLVVSGVLLAILAGVLNWGKRENQFERVNDVFQTFLLVLSLPAFTVKIAATNGEQAIKDWLVGACRISTMEVLEKEIHKRLRGNKRRGWIAIQRVKCETDDKQNWTAPDNMCFKTSHLNGNLRARRDRTMADLELVFGTDGKRARSWVELSNETNILGRDVNHLQFTCGTTLSNKTSAFFSHTPSRRVWFA